MLIMALVIALSPVLMLRTLSAGYSSMVLVAVVFIGDACARRSRLWIRYESEHVLLRKILSSDTVESVYANARDENRMPSDANDLSFFGERPAVEANPVHYLRYLWVKRLLDEVRHPDGGCILDLSCQYGLMTTLLDRPGHFVVATDLNPDSLKSMRRLSRQLALVRADARALSFHPNSFDLINFTEVLEDFADPRPALAEQVRVLSPDGILVVSAPQVFTGYTVHKRRAIRMGTWPWGWEDQYSARRLRRMGKGLGLKVEQVFGYQYWLSWGEPAWVLRDLYGKLHRRNPLAAHTPFLQLDRLYNRLWNWLERRFGHLFLLNVVAVFRKLRGSR
jgi:ubiquinone/menaquinone biosynthesis C-methylase UbiE